MLYNKKDISTEIHLRVSDDNTVVHSLGYTDVILPITFLLLRLPQKVINKSCR